MGPLRGRLGLATALLLCGSPAVAEVCDKERPDWDGLPASALSEAISLFGSPVGLVLLAATAFAIRFRSTWGGLAVTVCWTIFVSIVVQYDPTGIRQQAMKEGCLGEPTLFIAAAIAICIATILYTAPRKSGDN